jgi:hypothetical protein
MPAQGTTQNQQSTCLGHDGALPDEVHQSLSTARQRLESVQLAQRHSRQGLLLVGMFGGGGQVALDGWCGRSASVCMQSVRTRLQTLSNHLIGRKQMVEGVAAPGLLQHAGLQGRRPHLHGRAWHVGVWSGGRGSSGGAVETTSTQACKAGGCGAFTRC